MAGPETRLDIAKQHIAEARKVVEQQKQLIERRKASKLDTTSAEAVLRNFERALADFEDHLADIENKNKRKRRKTWPKKMPAASHVKAQRAKESP